MQQQQQPRPKLGRCVPPSRPLTLPVRAVAAVPKTASAPATSTSKSSAAVSPEVAKDLYYDMILGRDFEDMCAQMYYRGKMFGFVHLYCGQEAVSTGIVRCGQSTGIARCDQSIMIH